MTESLSFIASKKAVAPGMRSGRLSPALLYKALKTAPLASPFGASCYGEQAGGRLSFIVEPDDALRAWATEATEQLYRLAEASSKELFGKALSPATIQSRLTPLVGPSGHLRLKLRVDEISPTRFWSADGDALLDIPELARTKVAVAISAAFIWSRSDGHWGVSLEAEHVMVVETAGSQLAPVECPF
jgi:hypothetical protein